jgi:hypothetical protein
MNFIFIHTIHQQFLPYGRADLTASASLQPIRGIQIQLHGPLPCPSSNAREGWRVSTRE